MNSKTLLVVMPAYNSEQTIEKSIKSILEQSYSNLRLVIVDDFSSDSTLDIAMAFAKSDKRVSVYHNKKNLGAYYARNIGLYANIKEPWGYFTTHDADDVSNKKRYSILINMLSQNANGVQDAFTRRELETGKEIITKVTMAHAVFKREVFEQIGYFELSRFGADWEYWERLKAFNNLNNKTTKTCSNSLGTAYIHGKNLTSIIPINSPKRKRYVSKVKKDIEQRKIEKRFHRGFTADYRYTVKVKY